MGIVKGILKYTTKAVAGVTTLLIDQAFNTNITDSVQKGINDIFEDPNNIVDVDSNVRTYIENTSKKIETKREELLEAFTEKLGTLPDEKLLRLSLDKFNDYQIEAYYEELDRRGLKRDR